MQPQNLYIKDWMAIHPYTNQQPSDGYFIDLANRFLRICPMKNIPATLCKKICLYAAAYFEDVISGLGLWHAFVARHTEWYGSALPFYRTGSDYVTDEINEEDIRFILWNTLQKATHEHPYIHPLDPLIETTARSFFHLLEEEYETAPANEMLQDFFKDSTDADRKLRWLFGHTYLTEPSVQEYIENVTEADQFIIPCGPLALFLYEWIDLLTEGKPGHWKEIEKLYFIAPTPPKEMMEMNHHLYELFTQGTNGASIVYLDGYEALRHFLTGVLQWPDDDNHTMPQMKENKNFVMKAHPEKGILLAKDINECISDPLNPMYHRETASREAFRLLTVPMLCPPDLLTYLISHHYLPDAQFPVFGEKELVQAHADFIARHSLLYYYRGD